ncbi:MAG: YgjV family protein [Alphaproteobacteria bacterium]|nr:YgjV family protein [Alphaproteobacteria bacterium]NCQ87899.1 YgjV family protein [Alphaproteobacteria bacterium]NCT05594.1 YgjV family protein [Alphaproteobacteria bacterium]
MSGFEIAAIFLFLIGGLYKSPRKMIAVYTFSNFLFLFVYLDMALYMAAVSIGLSTIRGAASLFLSDKHNKYSAFILTLIIVCLIAIEISHYADILILLAAVAIGLSAHFRDDCCHVSYDNNHLSSVVDYSFFDIWGI